MTKTRKNYRKSKTLKRRKSRKGGTFADTLRAKTRKERNNSYRRSTISTRDRNRFNRSGRTYAVSQEILTPALDEWKEERFVVDNKFGPSESAFYAGPALQNAYLSQTQGIKPIPHGKEGTVVYTTGHVYKGDFNQGKREGYGELKIKDGPTYKGEWKADTFVPFSEYKKSSKPI